MQSTYQILELSDSLCSRQLKITNLTSRLRKVNICDVHKFLSSDFIINWIPDEKVFGKKGKHINDPQVLKEVSVIETFLQKNFPNYRIRHN